MQWTRWIWGAAGAVALATGVGYGADVHVPHKTVASPGPDASPTDVVRTYVQAINDRDYSTANNLLARGPALKNHRWFDAPTIKQLEILHVAGPYKGASTAPSSSVASYQQVVQIDTQARFNHWDEGLPDGQQGWSYYLARNANTERWRIVDQGQG
ncbi:hypothetical protein [Allobranchiibius sp. GilTou38]|uniref:hypothetical protein n=1 Tax=Allobranchiibius sp. GilTou38 TaxID=2815210 RepID=UPI001AA1C2C6|nr:hypothetical protein [Allobranchiibius sp. GilTou38]MBO1766444.1 hypothetical protein [Allobranchiibius sp. GilTou38]